MSTTTRQMFDAVLEPVKGWFSDTGLTRVANLSPNVTFLVRKGRVAHRNSIGDWEMGASGHQLPYFLNQNSDDADVQQISDLRNGIFRASGNISGGNGLMAGWCAKGDFEIETTEFDDTASYALNDPVRAQSSNTVAATGGLLTNAGITIYTNCICGWVSDIPTSNCDQNRVIRITTDFLPGTVGN